MTWLQRYRVRSYFKNSIWILPFSSAAVALVALRSLHLFDEAMGWKSDIDPETARTVLATMASAMFTFITFVCSLLLVALQLASAQLTPRIIAAVFRDPITKFSLSVFVFTFTFSLAVLVRIETSVPLLTSYVASYGCLVSLGLFLFLIDHIGKWLRPSGALRVMAIQGRNNIKILFPRRVSDTSDSMRDPVTFLTDEPVSTIVNSKDGVLLAFDAKGLVSLATRADCVIELVPQVGDFIAAEDPLFRTFQGGTNLTADTLHQFVAVGQERTVEQDPAFAFRVIVDIASKALSPAINDPTTAILAIDQIHHLLRSVGGRELNDGRETDQAGRLRLVYPTPDWEDFVKLGVTEIREYGGNSIQVNRRLRAMLENLIQTLPEKRRPVLRQELDVLRRSTERCFAEPEDRALADVSDLQGIGGKSGRSARRV